jgi:hypothetical protein
VFRDEIDSATWDRAEALLQSALTPYQYVMIRRETREDGGVASGALSGSKLQEGTAT